MVASTTQIVLDFPEELNLTKESVGSIRSFLKDIEKNKRGNETLCRITNELRELMYNAEDILADCSTGIYSSKSFLGGLLPRKIYSRHKIGKELKNINQSIRRSMLKHLGDVSSDGDKREMLVKIQRYLDGKRYFLVLDDVWKLDGGWWTRLESCLPKANGSCVVTTSRNIEIVRKMRGDEDRIHKPDLLTKEEGWTLFSKIVFAAGRKDMSGNTELKDIGIEIVRKCHGLPLAIKAVGGSVASLPTSPSERRRIMNTFTDLLSENPDFDSATMSFLRTYLKPCLHCFSIFPEDCIVLRDELTRWWIGEGFVPLKDGRLLVESAEDCFMGLVNRCLVEVVERDYNGKVYTRKMHDLVRDLVIEMGKSKAFYHEDNNISRRMPVNDGNGGTTNQMSTICSVCHKLQICWQCNNSLPRKDMSLRILKSIIPF